MRAMAFDTLKYANTLKAAGFTPEQAEAQTSALWTVLDASHQEIATKGDVLAVKNDLLLMKQELDSRLIQLEQRMTIKLGSMMVVAIGLVAALVKWL
jgi:hypothetical protein